MLMVISMLWGRWTELFHRFFSSVSIRNIFNRICWRNVAGLHHVL